MNAQTRAKLPQVLLLFLSLKSFQAAGVLAQIEKNNKKRQGVEV
jgi:hypothetical protein